MFAKKGHLNHERLKVTGTTAQRARHHLQQVGEGVLAVPAENAQEEHY